MDEKLLEALTLIRKECNKHEGCTTCPMRDGFNSGRCAITNDSPDEWNLKGDEDNRVFI